MSETSRNTVLRDHLMFVRQRRAITRPDMAKRLGLSNYALKEFEGGLKRIPDSLMFKVADELKIDPAKVFHPFPVPERTK